MGGSIEFLHGRNHQPELFDFDWQSANLANKSWRAHSTIFKIAELVTSACDLGSRQVRGGISELLSDVDERRRFLQARLERKSEWIERPDLWRLLAPLDNFVVLGRLGAQIDQLAIQYRAEVLREANLRRLTTHLGNDLMVGALMERRGRAVERARWSFEEEAKQLGDDFELGRLEARLFRMIAIAEFALIVGSWTSGPENASLCLAANALRSAWILWLEDTDMSLPCMRVVFEQTCRARTWRLKPNRASRIEQGPSAPIRWVDGAGWGRLSVLVKSFGEFSHLRVSVRIDGARNALTALQPDPTELTAANTARGHALDAATILLADEVAARLRDGSPALERAFQSAVTLQTPEEQAHKIEDLLSRGLRIKNFDFGPATFVKVPRQT